MSEANPTRRAYVRLTDAAVEDLERLAASDPPAVRKVLAKMLLLERNPQAGEALLGDLMGFRKLTVGDRTWRIVWRVTADRDGNEIIEISEVWGIGARADAEVYAEMARRVSTLNGPTTRALAEVLERLGRAAAGYSATPERVYDPLPDWLAKRLEHTAGMAPADVRNLTGAQAMDLWDRFQTSPKTQL